MSYPIILAKMTNNIVLTIMQEDTHLLCVWDSVAIKLSFHLSRIFELHMILFSVLYSKVNVFFPFYNMNVG